MYDQYETLDRNMQQGIWHDSLAIVTGDEPHYLSVTSTLIRHQSIYVDDFFLDDNPDPNLVFPNYLYKDYKKNCHPTIWHGYKTTDNKCAPHHNLGLSFLLIPGYFWGGILGSLTTMILISSLTAIIFFRFVRKITNEKISFVATLLVIFGTIFFSFYDSIYPEPVAALILISGFYIFFSERISTFRYLSVGMLVGLLPFFKFSFIVPTVIVILFLVIFSLKDRQYRKAILIAIPFLLVLGAFFYHTTLIYEDTILGKGGPLETTSTSFLENIFDESGNPLDILFKGLTSNLFSRNYGLLIFSPLLMISIFGTKQIWTTNKRVALLSYVLVITFIVAQSYSFPFAAGWTIPSRYFVFLIPIMGIWLALLLQKYHKNWFFIGILSVSTIAGIIFNVKFAQIFGNHTLLDQRHQIMLDVYHGLGEIFPYYLSQYWNTEKSVFWGNTSDMFWVFLISYTSVFIAYLVLPFLIPRIRKTIH